MFLRISLPCGVVFRRFFMVWMICGMEFRLLQEPPSLSRADSRCRIAARSAGQTRLCCATYHRKGGGGARRKFLRAPPFRSGGVVNGKRLLCSVAVFLMSATWLL